jgi:hypothetical protein
MAYLAGLSPAWYSLLVSLLPGSEVKTQPLFSWLVGFICLAILLGLSKAYKIYINDEELVFHAFGRRKRMKRKEMRSSAVHLSIEGSHSSGISWQFHSYDGKRIEIPLGYYSTSDMQALAQQAIDKAKEAKVSARIQDFAAGKFPLVSFLVKNSRKQE